MYGGVLLAQVARAAQQRLRDVSDAAAPTRRLRSINMSFLAPVSLRKLMVIGGGSDVAHPSRVKVYVGQENLDFQSLEDVRPTYESRLPVNGPGEAFLNVHPPSAFTNVTTVAFFFDENHSEGEEDTVVRYIGMQGDHTHGRAEAVHAEYELLCQHGNETVPKPDLFNQRDLQG